MSAQFLLFASDTYGVSGGADDFVASFWSLKAAFMHLERRTGPEAGDWAHAFDTGSETVVARWHQIGPWQDLVLQVPLVALAPGGRQVAVPALTRAPLGTYGWVSLDEYVRRVAARDAMVKAAGR